ncbi:multimeric flavodoxin WrbA [Xanthomonas sp. JAI131]|uniref:hypothetical protein n=1 Tax=Xanthomonas sp. JAI131 TaxID=2723067 RepID=UPI0015CA9E5B|nr:hypothetical protein [Xanthomonas sp. JAI131]NYF19465.1 multimeric flavodoxin WrbA [Xanthomonas sp. JAI131]
MPAAAATPSFGGRWKVDSVLRQLGEPDAMVFAAPTYMGEPAAQFNAIANAAAAVRSTGTVRRHIAGVTRSLQPVAVEDVA